VQMKVLLALLPLVLLAGCGGDSADGPERPAADDEIHLEAPERVAAPTPQLLIDRDRLGIYHPVQLKPDLSDLSDAQREMLRTLVEASEIMEALFWQQAYGEPETLLEAFADDPEMVHFIRINYGPWDRLDGNRPFLSGYVEKPAGARFYPEDITREEYEAWDHPDKNNQYSLVRRDDDDALVLVLYHEAFADELTRAAGLLREAAELAESEAFANYLRLRAEALLTGEYRASDMAWMDVRDNDIELVYGPIESYEDGLFGLRTAFEAFVLIKDHEWSARLERYAGLLPALQRGLPVPDEYKAETPGTDADLNAYDALYYAGDANAGAKTIAINLPNDEQVQLEKGTRRLQIKNTMRAKFDHILVPIAELLIDQDQIDHITFDAFFANIMFHEVAHGLGIKFTIDDGRPVRAALGALNSSIEEGKADIVGLNMIGQLIEMGEWDGDLHDHYVTFLAGIFRSTRFGAASAHGRANMAAFNFFLERGAFRRNEETGRYRVDFDAFGAAVDALSERILTLQGDGDAEATEAFLAEYGRMPEFLAADLERAGAQGIPVDLRLIQGADIAGL
ncbi:MAG: dipeptidyl-peptidase 3 family protein, partial [Wenzhouxiangellaceae bacterium]